MVMVVAVPPRTPEAVDDRRAEWVQQYRGDHAAADLWARGLRHVSHSVETQERVFRLAEQLERRGVDRRDLFLALEEADRCVALSAEPLVAAQAGYRVISALAPISPASVVICAGENLSTLRALGFDPLAFDGHDPAAFAWAMFELSTCAEADRRSQWRRCLPEAFATPTAIGLARL